jgi:intein/homing endonuclease
MRDLFFAKCLDPDHLQQWVKMFWGVNLPKKSVSRYSNCSPLMSVWEIYSACLHERKRMDTLFIAPRGGGKCSAKGTLIPLQNYGLRVIENIKPGDVVYSGFAWRKVLQTFDEGVKESYGILTKNGARIEGSVNHRVMVASKQSGVEWKHLSDLKPGDFAYLAAPEAPTVSSTEDFDKGWLVGAIVGDGSIVDTVKNRRVDFCAGDELVANKYCQLMQKLFCKTPRKWQNSLNSYGYQVNSSALINWLHTYIDGRLAYDKRLKSLDFSDSFLVGFLVGLFDTDGSRDEITLANKELIEQVSHLLTRFGVFNRVKYDRKEPRYSQFTKSEVRYHSVHFISSLPKCLLPVGAKSAAFHNESEKRREQYRYPSYCVEFFIKELRDTYLLHNGWITINKKAQRVQVPFADHLSARGPFIEENKLEAWSSWARSLGLEELANQLDLVRNGYFQEITEVFKSEAHFYDLEVDQDHSYVSNGIVSHNTLGVAIAESAIMFHDRRGVVHVGAIEKQAKRAYSYFQNFVSKNRRIVEPMIDKSTIEKTVAVVDNEQVSLECLPATMSALNGPHEACIGGSTSIIVKNFTDSSRSRIAIQAAKLHKLVQSGYEIEALSYNHELRTLEFKRIKASKATKKAERLKISRKSGRRPLWCTTDHKIYSPKEDVYKEAINFQVGDTVLITKKTLSDNVFCPKRERVIPTQQLLPVTADTAVQVMLGSLLGDGGVYKRWFGSTKAEYKESHGETQIEYALWKKEILKEHLEFYEDKLNYSGYKKCYSGIKITSKASKWLMQFANFRKDPSLLLDQVDRLALAVWYMDDGYHSSICTHGFSFEYQQKLLQMLESKFDIKANLDVERKSDGRTFHYIRFVSHDEFAKFYRLIECYIHPSMKYKLEWFRGVYNCSTCGKREYRANTSNGHKVCLDCDNNRLETFEHDMITAIELLPQKRQVYDFTIEGNHNFFAGGLLVHNCVVMDELDTLSPEGLQAYKQINGIPVKHRLTGAPPVKIGISTRKSAHGLVQQQMDMAVEQGRTIRMWNQIDLTEKCQPSRHGTNDIVLYVDQSKMRHIPEEEYDKLSDEKKKDFVAYQATDGCARCPLFSVCLGDLKNQDAEMTAETSTMISTIEDVIGRVKGADTDWVLAELMCLKPSMEGVVFKEFDKARHVVSYDKAWKVLTGMQAETPIDEVTFIQELHRRQIPIYAGVDFGWTAPSAVIYVAIDEKDNIYILRVFAITKTNDPTFINFIKSRWHRYYKVQMYYPDIAEGSGVDLMKAAGLPVASKIDKSENLGVQLIKRALNVPGTSETKMFILEEHTSFFVHEMERYHYEKDAGGNPIDGKFANGHSHSLDGLRYVLTSIMGRSRFAMATDGILSNTGDPLLAPGGEYLRPPNFHELAMLNNIPVAPPEAKPFNRADDDDGPDGFSWSF